MADLGRKHTCFKCSAKFYDLKKPRALCPKCGADQAEAPIAAAPPPPPPQTRGPRMVDPPEEPAEPPDEDAEVVPADAEAEGEAEDDDPRGVETDDLDEPAGEDSFD